ncbi:hypothetical protein H0X10_00545 [Candidatus Saccharibacteria bacterium]|nr:hypothetical protein [Candidatus Saccharibacteria bacterium]
MNKLRNNASGSIPLIFLLGILIVVIIAGVAWYVSQSRSSSHDNSTGTQQISNENNESDEEVPSGIIGYVGGSLTSNATDGYKLLNGSKLWDAKRADFGGYGGGTIDKWADGINTQSETNKYWQSFDGLYQTSKSRGATKVVWVQLLGRGEQTDDEYYDDALAVIDEVKRRIPEAAMYVSAMNDYNPTTTCKDLQADAPLQMQRVLDRVVQASKARRGPEVGTLTPALTGSGCHANETGKELLGKNLLDFFGK